MVPLDNVVDDNIVFKSILDRPMQGPQTFTRSSAVAERPCGGSCHIFH